jgi:hypothetical protein
MKPDYLLKAFAFGEPLSFASPKESGAKKRRPQVAAKSRPKIVRPRRLGNSLVATAPHSDSPSLKTLATQFFLGSFGLSTSQ